MDYMPKQEPNSSDNILNNLVGISLEVFIIVSIQELFRHRLIVRQGSIEIFNTILIIEGIILFVVIFTILHEGYLSNAFSTFRGALVVCLLAIMVFSAAIFLAYKASLTPCALCIEEKDVTSCIEVYRAACPPRQTSTPSLPTATWTPSPITQLPTSKTDTPIVTTAPPPTITVDTPVSSENIRAFAIGRGDQQNPLLWLVLENSTTPAMVSAKEWFTGTQDFISSEEHCDITQPNDLLWIVPSTTDPQRAALVYPGQLCIYSSNHLENKYTYSLSEDTSAEILAAVFVDDWLMLGTSKGIYGVNVNNPDKQLGPYSFTGPTIDFYATPEGDICALSYKENHTYIGWLPASSLTWSQIDDFDLNLAGKPLRIWCADQDHWKVLYDNGRWFCSDDDADSFELVNALTFILDRDLMTFNAGGEGFYFREDFEEDSGEVGWSGTDSSWYAKQTIDDLASCQSPQGLHFVPGEGLILHCLNDLFHHDGLEGLSESWHAHFSD